MKKNILKKMLALTLVASLVVGGGLYAKVANAQITEFAQIIPVQTDSAANVSNVLMSNVQSSGGGEVTTDSADDSTTSIYFEFTVPSDSMVYMKLSVEADKKVIKFLDWHNVSFTIYGDKDMNYQVAKPIEKDETSVGIDSIYLKKGTYYIKANAELVDKTFAKGRETHKVGVAIAYQKFTGAPMDAKLKLSTTKATTGNVILTVTPNYPEAKIAVIKGSINADSTLWQPETYLTDTNKYTIKENGKYTILIKTKDSGQVYAKTYHINIDNIDKSKPSTPKVESYKVNSTSIKGTADAGTIVTATIGSKTYSATARDKGSFSIKVPKLAKGTKITLIAKDEAGNKSDKKVVKVK